MFVIIHELIEFKIPSNCRFLSDMSQDIYDELKSKSVYHVQSNVTLDVCESFINYLMKRENPTNINLNNISEYEKLSQEFEIMGEIIQMNKNFIEKSDNFPIYHKNQKLQKTLKEIREKNEQKTKDYQKIISILFKNELNFRFSKRNRELFHYCYDNNVKFVDLLTRKEVIHDGLSFVLFEKEEEAIVFKIITQKSDILIPESIDCGSKKYTVTGICENAFANCKKIRFVKFTNDSKLRFIDNRAFKNSSVFSISIPSTVKRIGESAFSECRSLFRIDFSENSELESFEKNTFNLASLSDIFIPPHVTRICKLAFIHCNELKLIKFSPNSELKIIDECAFISSSLKDISIPSSVKELDQSLSHCKNLTNVEVMKDNEMFKMYENKLLIGKSNPKNKNYDILHLACRDIVIAKIPSFIKHIKPYAFYLCKSLQEIEFSEDSELQTIGEYAFAKSSLKSIKIPKHVKKIGEYAFFCCKLKSFSFSEQPELNTIEACIFSFCLLTNFSIPSSITKLKNRWSNNSNLMKVEVMKDNENFTMYENKLLIGKSNPKNRNYDILHFACKDITTIKIPSFIKIIQPHAFSECNLLQNVEFSEDSELQVIGCRSFSHTQIQSIKIPKHVTKIDKLAFFSCYSLEKIELDENSKLNSIGYSFASFSNFESLYIPSSFVELKEDWCYGITKLNNIEISPNNEHFTYYNNQLILEKKDMKSDIFNVIRFARRDIEKVIIPSFVTKISSNAFNKCKKLSSIEFEDHSELQIINKSAFAESSSFESIFIPSNVVQIDDLAFMVCSKLTKVEFEKNSKLKSIGSSAFGFSNIHSISIPDSVETIKRSFINCKKLLIFEISEKSKLELLNRTMFSESYNILVMVPINLIIILE